MLLLCSYGIIVMLLKSTILKSFLSYNNVEGSYKCAKIQIFIWLCNTLQYHAISGCIPVPIKRLVVLS